MNWAACIWVALAVIFLIVEAACPIHLVSIWFVAGSVVAMIAAMLHWALWLQIALFVLVSGALLATLWPLVRKHLNPSVTKTNVDAVVGSTGLVTVAINNLTATGQVKLGAMEWTARSTAGTTIPVGTVVRVDKIEGVKAFVSPAEVTANV
jgi:membrane protein implicated in regulation of membrane protease activity